MKTHGMSRTKIYKIWKGMIGRCTNPKGKYFDRYMGRGITICKEWRNSFENFYKDMGDPPAGHSLDRVNNDKGYSKENCRWATPKQQQNNRRGCIKLTFNQQTKSLVEWSEITNLSRTVIWKRLDAGWSVEKALTTPLRTDARHARKNNS